jgi:hypothetical protein
MASAATENFGDKSGLLADFFTKVLSSNNAALDNRSHPEGRSEAEHPP